VQRDVAATHTFLVLPRSLQEAHANAMTMRAILRVAVLAAAASCVLAEKGDMYGKDGKEKGSVVEVLTRTLGQMRGML
jgi:hypothetical protein